MMRHSKLSKLIRMQIWKRLGAGFEGKPSHSRRHLNSWSQLVILFREWFWGWSVWLGTVFWELKASSWLPAHSLYFLLGISHVSSWFSAPVTKSTCYHFGLELSIHISQINLSYGNKWLWLTMSKCWESKLCQAWWFIPLNAVLRR